MARLLLVTTTMNLFGYSYTALVAPIGRDAGFPDAAVGVLAAAEPAGALCGGLLMVRFALPGLPLLWLGAGAGALFCALLAAVVAAPLWPLCAALAFGGLGVAAYTNMQTGIVMRAAPPPCRAGCSAWSACASAAGRSARSWPGWTGGVLLAAGWRWRRWGRRAWLSSQPFALPRGQRLLVSRYKAD